MDWSRPYTDKYPDARRAQPKWLSPSLRRRLSLASSREAYGTAVYVNVATSWKPVTDTVTVPAPVGHPTGSAYCAED
jgi:hypothetical protein